MRNKGAKESFQLDSNSQLESWVPWRVLWTVSKGDYIYGVCPEHPRATKHGYVLLHRLVMENKLKRLLDDDEIVHHRNEVKKDNEEDNLEVILRSAHTRMHHK